MPKQGDRRKLPYTAEQMYALVADVESYPEFLPWCAAARIRSRTDKGECEVMEADLVISFKVFRERFGSRVTLWKDGSRIDTDYIDGPFKFLRSRWLFEPTDEGCVVDFHVDFEFKNRVLQRVIGMVFDEAMRLIVRAFESRAHKLYGGGAGRNRASASTRKA